jgi:hypothetical protein
LPVSTFSPATEHDTADTPSRPACSMAGSI